MRIIALTTCVLWFSFLFSCKEETQGNKEPAVNTASVIIPAANSDSIYAILVEQLEFGYRIPGTSEHLACGRWLEKRLKNYGAKVTIQNFKTSFFDHKDVDCFNIIAQFNTNIKKRVLLAAHWDSRMVADKDLNESNKKTPIEGADDGASGVAALLEIARLINENPINLGVDIILFDAEDQGNNNDSNETWCLGSQYWSKNKHQRNYSAKYGILFDMVGAKAATFGKEGISRNFAPQILDKVWTLAQRMGYSDLFVNQNFPSISDDHYYVNQYAGIPMIDIVNYDLKQNKFAAYHHTLNDNINIISKRNLRAVTQVVTAVVYKESEGSF